MPMKQQEQPAEAGAPSWMVTYGDMMTLLLCFFVMLVALSEVKTEKFLRVLDSLRRALGYSQERAPLPMGEATGNSVLDSLSYFEDIRGQSMHQSQSSVQGQQGRFGRVTMVRDGSRTVVGGRIGFARASADVPDKGQAGLDRIAELLRGHPNKIEVRGHASRQPLPPVSVYRDKWDLAYARARAVADYLITRDIDTERIRIVTCGDQEPLQETYETAERWRNRRVEVVMMESTPDEFRRPPARAERADDAPAPANGGPDNG